jgi:hypothetical protein
MNQKLAERLASKILNRSAEHILNALMTYPRGKPGDHWVWIASGASAGKPSIDHGGLQVASRFILSVIAGDVIPATFRASKNCAIVNCVNPACYTLRPHNQNFYGFVHTLPGRLSVGEAGDAQDIADLLEEFANCDDTSLPLMIETYGKAFTHESIEKAHAEWLKR